MAIFRPGFRSGFRPRLVFFCLLLLTALSCGGLEKFEKRELAIQGRPGRVVLKAEIAQTDAQKQQGLMYRKEVKDGEAMLFVYTRDQVLSFWMKNTLVPLSIAYIAADGRILEIFDMESGSLDHVRSSRSVRYALEVPRGWFSRAGIEAGDKVEIEPFSKLD